MFASTMLAVVSYSCRYDDTRPKIHEVLFPLEISTNFTTESNLLMLTNYENVFKALILMKFQKSFYFILSWMKSYAWDFQCVLVMSFQRQNCDNKFC